MKCKPYSGDHDTYSHTTWGKGCDLGKGCLGERGQIAILSNIVRKGLTDKVTFEQKLEGDQRNTLGDIWEKNIPFK